MLRVPDKDHVPILSGGQKGVGFISHAQPSSRPSRIFMATYIHTCTHDTHTHAVQESHVHTHGTEKICTKSFFSKAWAGEASKIKRKGASGQETGSWGQGLKEREEKNKFGGGSGGALLVEPDGRGGGWGSRSPEEEEREGGASATRAPGTPFQLLSAATQVGPTQVGLHIRADL